LGLRRMKNLPQAALTMRSIETGNSFMPDWG
jgi:hypothetical protein